MLYSDFVRTRMNSLFTLAEAEGYPCILNKSKGKPLKDYKIYGNTEQEGTPTPNNPLEIISLGDLVTSTDSDYNTIMQYGLSSLVAQTPAEVGNVYRVTINVNRNLSSIKYNIYLSEPLRKIGDIVDYLDFKESKIKRKLASTILDGVSNNKFFIGKNTDDGVYKSFYLRNISLNLKGYETILSTHFQYNRWIPPTGNFWWSSAVTNGMRLDVAFLEGYDDSLSNTQKLSIANNWLNEQYINGTPVTLCYVLEEETEENVTLPMVKTLNGTVIIDTQNNTVESSNIYAKYIK